MREGCLPRVAWVVLFVACTVAMYAAWSRAADSDAVVGEHPRPFGIRVVDDVTGRGVPLITLTTTNAIELITDSNGWVAFDEPGLLGGDVWFTVSSPGYQFKANGFGFRGVSLKTTPGGEATIKIHRTQIAERLYRITGQGIYADSVRLGKEMPIEHPVLDARVVGQDSAQTVVYKGRVYWFWGDTVRPEAPLGNFHMTGATSLLPSDGGLDPSVGVNLDYFESENGFVQPLFNLKEKGLVWSGNPMVLKSPEGERLVCQYTRLLNMSDVRARGLAVWNDQTHQFEPWVDVPLDARLKPIGLNPFRYADDGVEYIYFPGPYPLIRVRATWADVSDLSRYEGWTPLMPGTAYQGAESQIERDSQGHVVYGWKANTGMLDEAAQKALVDAGLLKPDEVWLDLHDVKTDRNVALHGGTVRWNPYRRKWILIAVELRMPQDVAPQDIGNVQKLVAAAQAQKIDSVLGNVWYSEADQPQGPFRKAVQIATHPLYSFYHPVQHEFFDQEGGRIVYFEGTYTAMFSGNSHPTPRYDYNQIMYRLDLSDPQLKLDH